MKVPALFLVFVLSAVALGRPPERPYAHQPYAQQLTHRDMAIAIKALEARVTRLEARLHRAELRSR